MYIHTQIYTCKDVAATCSLCQVFTEDKVVGQGVIHDVDPDKELSSYGGFGV